MSSIKTLPLRIACDGESSSGKSTAAKLISKKYTCYTTKYNSILFVLIKKIKAKIINILSLKF